MNRKFQFTIEPWSVSHENKEYQTPIFNLFRRSMRLQDEAESLSGDFYVLQAPEWINVIPITPENEVVLVEQYRYGIEQPTLEIPGGMVDAGEEPGESARRELLEETGYRSDRWKSLGKVSANPAIMDNFAHIYLAEECVYEKETNFDTHERINVHLVPMQTFLEYVADGTIHHSIVVAAVARYLLMQSKT
ncbi:MAG TPA: NUDIX hydrolase [Fodinibius sp.]|nr:NUDIX hydrolase [Fodinibius sp.]